MLTFVLDYEGFYDSYKKKIIVQEYAAGSLENNFSYHDFVKLPKNYDKKIFHFVCKKLNHIPDCIGNVNFQELITLAQQLR